MEEIKTYFEIEAGSVAYKVENDELKYLVIFRVKLNDFTLPKGHLESGESLEEAAIRETKEESGVDSKIDTYIDTFEYKVKEKRKDGSTAFIIRRVYNYLVSVTSEDSDFKNPDIAEGLTTIEWLPFEDAYKKLSYDSNKDLLVKSNLILTKKNQTNCVEQAVKIYSKIENEIKSNLALLEKITHIGLVGSVNDGEAVNGWSDLDILLICDSDKFGNIDNHVILELKKIHNYFASLYPSIEISLLPHTLDDLKNYVAFDYLRTYQFATIKYQSTNLILSDYIANILDKRQITSITQKRSAVYHIRHLRFNLIRVVASKTRPNKPIAKLIIDRIVETGVYLVGFYGFCIQKKSDRLLKIQNLIEDKEIVNIYKTVTELRNNWPNVKESESEQIIKDSLEYLKMIESYIVSIHPEETPEEYMNKKIS